jgi:hypothetical protein
MMVNKRKPVNGNTSNISQSVTFNEHLCCMT